MSTASREKPLPPDGPIWWWLSQIIRPIVGRSPAVRVEGLTPREATDRILDRAFGPTPNPESRRNMMQVLTTGTMLVGGLLGMLGLGLGIALLAATGSTSAHLIARAFAMLFTAPSISVGFIWAARWSLARRRWREGIPPRGSQPRAADLAYAVPLAVVVALFFASV